MWFFGSNPKLSDYDDAATAAEAALRPQIRKLLIARPNTAKGIRRLTSAAPLLLLHGFVCFYAKKYRIKRNDHQVAVTFKVFKSFFGDEVAGAMKSALREQLCNAGDLRMLKEGENAAAYYQREGLQLIAAFLGDVVDENDSGTAA
ncbi:MAG: hypothetical protein WD793_07305 [Steroidobacteraceae bacterium]